MILAEINTAFNNCITGKCLNCQIKRAMDCLSKKNCPYFVKSSSLPARKGYEGLASVVRMRATMLQSQIIPNKKKIHAEKPAHVDKVSGF